MITNREKFNDDGKYVEEYNDDIKVDKHIYYSQIMPTLGIFEIVELRIVRIRKFEDSSKDYFVGTDKNTGQSYLFTFKDIDKCIFCDRDACLTYVKDVQYEHKNDNISNERYYDE